MKRPNFFIVGAPKCGTTALSEYLRRHPYIFFCPHKEVSYFCEDFPGIRTVASEKQYLQYFKRANDKHIAVGEGSVRYLYSSIAIQRIFEFNPKSKIIIMLRNPVDLVYACHSQALYSLEEYEPDFKKAWALQESRAKGNNITKRCPDPDAALQYRKIGMLGQHVERVLNIFPKEQVRIYFLEDFSRDTKEIYEDVLTFLGIPSDGRKYFHRINENKKHRNKTVAIMTNLHPLFWRKIRRWINSTLGKEIRLLNCIRKLNTVKQKRPPLDPTFRRLLIAEFWDDIEKLGHITNKDLSHYLLVD